MHDLVVRGGTVVDGTGAPGRTADIAVDDGVITDIARIQQAARRTIDADGALVTPGATRAPLSRPVAAGTTSR